MILFKPNPKIPILNKLPTKPVAGYDINQRLIRSNRNPAFKIRRSFGNGTLDIPYLGNGEIDENEIIAHVGSQNLFTFSEQLDNAAWSKSGGATVTPNSVTAPNGELTADTINFASGTSFLGQLGGSAGVTNTYSFSAKAGTLNSIRLYCGGIGNNFSRFANLTTGAITGSGGTVISAYTIDEGNGWFRCVMTSTPVNAPNWLLIADGASGTINVTNLQVSTGSTLQPYSPTTTTPRDGFGYFTSIYDQIGDNHLTQLTANLQPSIMENGILNKDENGNLYANFNSKLMEADLGIGTVKSIVAVYSKSVSSTNTHVFGSGIVGADRGINIFEDSTSRTNVSSANNRYYLNVDDALNKKIVVGENDGNIEYYKNGVQNILPNFVGTSIESPRISIGTAAFPFQGRFYTGLIFQNKLATNNRRNLERMLGKQNKISVV
jgi:hypothetical protein